MTKHDFKMSPTHKLRMAILDLDGTLTTVRSPFRYVSNALGYDDQAEDIYKQYLKSKITYEEWGQQEVALWEGLKEEHFVEILRSIPYRSGVIEFINQLKHNEVILALASAGFEHHVSARAHELGISFYTANNVEIVRGCLSGKFLSNVNGHNKKEIAQLLRANNNVSINETLVAGDSLGDIPMFSEALISIAVDPETVDVAQAATILLPEGDWKKAIKLINKIRPNWI